MTIKFSLMISSSVYVYVVARGSLLRVCVCVRVIMLSGLALEKISFETSPCIVEKRERVTVGYLGRE